MGSLITRKKQILMNSPHVETASGNIADFTTDLRAKLKSCKIEFLPVQEGSGDPSPTNIRPISGYTSLNISQSGENLLPAGSHTREQNGITFTYCENGDVHIEGKATGNAFLNVPTSMYFTITPGTYTLSGNRSDSNVNMYFVVSSANGGDIKWNMVETNTPKTRTIDFTDSSARIQISVVSGKTVNTTIHPRIERGSTATPVTTTPVAFNLAGNSNTIYGGYVDVVKGVLVQTHAYIEKAIADMNKESDTYPGWNNADVKEIVGAHYNKVNTRVITNISPFGSTAVGFNTNSDYTSGSMFLMNSYFGLTEDEWKATYPDLVVQFVIPFATPIEYPITPQLLKSLKGSNNIWSDANGNTTVEFWTH